MAGRARVDSLRPDVEIGMIWMANLRDEGVQQVFASAMAELHRSWPKLAAHERRQGLQAAVDGAANAAQKPGWDVQCRALAAGLDGQLRCDRNNWSLEVADAFVEGLNDDREAWLGSVSAIYHEMRHGEQWYLCAQGVLAEQFPLPGGAQPADPAGVAERDLRDTMGLPGAVVRHAIQRSRQFPHDLLSATRSWYDSLFGAGRPSQTRVLETIQHGGKVADHLHLAEEQDAWDVQQCVRERIRTLIGPSLDNRAYAALRSLFGE
jgi:hypothetical protein